MTFIVTYINAKRVFKKVLVYKEVFQISIPKIIHYCWFGKNPYPELTKKCINSWKKYCPDYEIIEWNEDNFNVNCNQYTKEAYDAKKWAFVTDYVRLFALYNYGGIYLDTDLELIKPIDSFLTYPAFSGFENEYMIPTAIMGSEKGNDWIKSLLKHYDNEHFVSKDGSLNLTTNVEIITKITKNLYDIELNNTFQMVDGKFALFPNYYFCPKEYFSEKITITEQTYAIHHFSSSWKNVKELKKHRHRVMYRKVFGKFGDVSLQFMSALKREIRQIFARKR